jgi:hypothetical protein
MKKKIVWPLVLIAAVLAAPGGLCQEGSPSPPAPNQVLKDVIPKGWLKKKTTIEKAEQDHLVTDRRLGPKPVPFGFINAQWEKFKAGIRIGDELWEFESPSESWADLAGRAGLCIVREGRIIDAITTRMN